MKFFWVCLCLMGLAVDAGLLEKFLNKNKQENIERIVGGQPADIKDFQYQLSVRFYGFHICGASIISENFALSLASCLEFKVPEQISFLAGSTNVLDPSSGLVSQASRLYFHPDFNFENNAFDVVIVLVRTPFVGENIQAVNLATPNMPMYPGLTAVIAGWGDNSDNDQNILHKVGIPIVSNEKCSEAWNEKITETAICAGKPNLDTCGTDNGGALVYCGLQIGINIKNSDGCDGSKPAVFTEIAHPQVRSFIRDITGI